MKLNIHSFISLHKYLLVTSPLYILCQFSILWLLLTKIHLSLVLNAIQAIPWHHFQGLLEILKFHLESVSPVSVFYCQMNQKKIVREQWTCSMRTFIREKYLNGDSITISWPPACIFAIMALLGRASLNLQELRC